MQEKCLVGFKKAQATFGFIQFTKQFYSFMCDPPLFPALHVYGKVLAWRCIKNYASHPNNKPLKKSK